MLYLLDANVLIDANRDYYSFDIVPQFWDWLIHMGNNGSIKIPIEIYEELKDGNDQLTDWIKDKTTSDALLLDEEAEVVLVQQIINNGYASDLSDIDIEKIGRDPFLISYGLVAPQNRCIVTTENSKPKKKRSNRNIPDVCKDFNILTLHTFGFVRKLNFNTNWNNP